MDWIESIECALEYMESHITEELTMEQIANEAAMSTFYFQKGFSMLCGITLGEYIRNRRLTLAGSEVVSTNQRIIDIGMKYGYDSPDAFTKAFSRFHGITPSRARRGDAVIKAYPPLHIYLTLKGGYLMEYKVVDKESFKVMGAVKRFGYDEAKREIPKFWDTFYEEGKDEKVCGMLGISFEEETKDNAFDYAIADFYKEGSPVPEGFEVRRIPALTWVVFPKRGPMPQSLQSLNEEIYSQWLPTCKDYKVAAGYNVELYDDASQYEMGTKDPNYYFEIWIPVEPK